MDFLNLQKGTNIPVSPGKLLIAEPFLRDPSFIRSVIFLCEHGTEGSVGFIINRATTIMLEDVLPEVSGYDIPLYQGGPVQADTMHMLHMSPEVFGGVEVYNHIYWGGSYDALIDAAAQKKSPELRLMLGYAGWSAGQLEKELEEGAWLVAEPDISLLFDPDAANIWKKAVRLLGAQYEYLINLPIDPQLN